MNNQPGQHWLLLRGLSRESAHWGDFIPRMHEAFPASKIHALDLPGTGRFHAQTSPNTIADIMEETRKQAIAQNMLTRPVTVLALSLGGMVAWEWLKRYPEDIAAAALVNTSFSDVSPFYRRLRWQSYGNFLGILLKNDIYRRELRIVRLVSNRRDHDAEIAAEWASIHTLRPISRKNSLRQIEAAARYRPGADNPQRPVLILNSRGDRLAAPACSEAIHRRWQLELQTHPWAGHDLSLDDGAWLATRLKNWVDSLGKH